MWVKASRLFVTFSLIGLSSVWGRSPIEDRIARSEVKVHLEDSSPTVLTISCQLTRWEPQEVVVEGETYQAFSFAEEAVAGAEGYPELPAVVRFLLMPPQSGAELIVKERVTRVLENINPLPFQNPIANEEDEAKGSSPRTLRKIDYHKLGEDFWPPEPARLGEPAIMRGYRLLPIVFYPLRYNPRTSQLEITDWIEVEVDFNSPQNRINLVTDPERAKPSRMMQRLISQIVLNPPFPERDPVVGDGAVVYVVGQGQDWNGVVNEIQPLVEWRRRQGWRTEILRVNNPATPANVVQALRQAYQNWSTPPEYIVLVGDTDGSYPIGFFDMRRGANYPYESDHPFTQLEGDDLLPEAVVGRIIYDNTNRLRGVVNKIVQYESDPYIGQGNEVGWQRRAALAAGDSRSGVTSIDILRWTKKLLIDLYDYQQVNERYWSQNEPQPNCRDFIINNINSGVSFLIYRGWTFISGYQFADVDNQRNGRMLPFTILATCNTGDYGEHVSSQFYYTERFIYHPDGGGIGSVGAAGATHTAYNNIYTTGIMKAILLDSIAFQGYAHWAGKWQLYTHYAGRGDHNHPENNQMEAWLTEFYIFNLMGDPATQLFTNTPRPLRVSAPQAIRRGETRIDLQVFYDQGDGVPAEGLNVCLYKPNPQGNDPHRYQILKTTDREGRVAFDLSPDWTAGGGTLKLTVWGLNVRTFLRDWEIGQGENFIAASSVVELDDDNDGNSRGDGDGVANPGEQLEVTVSFVNRGSQRPEGELNVFLTTSHPHLEIVEGEYYLGNAPQPGDSTTAHFVVRIGPGFPDGEKAAFQARVVAGEQSWTSSFLIPVVGPRMGKPIVRWVRDHLRPASAASFYLTLTNLGRRRASEMRGTLFSLTHTISVPLSQARFPACDPGDTTQSSDSLRLSAHPFHLGGQPARLGIALEDQGTYRDTVWFSIVVDTARPGSPFGPDNYGYVCFDNTDTGWFAAPEFNWVEIDPRRGGSGTNTQLRDDQQQADASVLVNLPFTFQYYGQEFNRITINSNGWIAMGDWRSVVSPRSRHIPAPENPMGMIAPFWADLIFNPNQGGVFYWYDEENHRFIVEWSNVRRLSPRVNDSLQTFQVILHDPRYYPSFTGDGDIVFQYLRIYPHRDAYDWDTPYFSCGIASPDLKTGLEYAYWGRYAYGAAPIQNGRAIKFTTLVEFVTGHARGRVLDAWTGMPLEGVLVSTTYGFYGITDANGEYFIPDMLVDTNYTFTASKRFYNDSTLTGIEIREGDTTWVDFALLHPEFSLSHDSLTYIMLADSTTETRLSLTNLGNGTMWFTTRYDYLPGDERAQSTPETNPPLRDEPDGLWDPLLIFDASNIGQGERDNSIQAVAFWRSWWYVAGGYNRNDTLNYFYRFTRAGELVDRIPQPFSNRLGIRDMEVYQGFLWCVLLDDKVYQVDPENGQLVWWWRVPVRNFTPRAITIDPNRQLFYLANVTGDLWVCRMEGGNDSTLVPVRSYPQRDPRDNTQIRTRGLAWFPDDPDGFNLYLLSNNEPVANPDYPDISLYKMNIETGEIRFLTDFHSQIEGSSYQPLGMSITAKWNNLVWVLAAVFDSQDQDRVGVFELAPNASWLNFEPRSGSLRAGEIQELTVTVSSAELDTGQYGVTVEFIHNAFPGFFRLPIELNVVLELPPPPPPDTDTVIVRSDDWLRKHFGLAQNRPNPFNSLTTIVFGLEKSGHTQVTIWDLQGREIVRLVDDYLPAGRHEVVWNASRMAAGIYFVRLESSGRRAIRKMVLLP